MSDNGPESVLHGERLKILFVGVGGQGVLTAARVIGDAALRSSLPVVVGQLHGMSQRGGSVQATVLIGPGGSSFIEDGGAHVLVGLEPLEALRALRKLSAATRIVINLGRVVPYTLAQTGQPYPDLDRVLDGIREVATDVVEVDGSAILEQTGTEKVLNVAMLGALAGLDVLPFGSETVWEAVRARCAPKFFEPNRRAFTLGMEAVKAWASR